MKRIIHLLLIAGILAFAPSCKKEGCMDPKATNYNSKAKKDDGSCKFETDTTEKKDTVDTDIPKVELFKGSCSDCIIAGGYLDAGKQLRFNIKATYDKPLKNIKVVRNRVGVSTTTPIDSNISGTSFVMEWHTTALAVNEKSVFTFTATGENGKSHTVTIELQAGAELEERNNLMFYRQNDDGDTYPFSFDIVNTVSVIPSASNSIKDINEMSNPTGAFAKKINSLNGSKFKKYAGTRTWLQISKNEDLQKAWDESGSEMDEVALEEDILIVIKSGQDGKLYIIYIDEIYEGGPDPAEITFNSKGIY